MITAVLAPEAHPAVQRLQLSLFLTVGSHQVSLWAKPVLSLRAFLRPLSKLLDDCSEAQGRHREPITALIKRTVVLLLINGRNVSPKVSPSIVSPTKQCASHTYSLDDCSND